MNNASERKKRWRHKRAEETGQTQRGTDRKNEYAGIAAHAPRVGPRSGKKADSLFAVGTFIAIDGEGKSLGPVKTATTKPKRKADLPNRYKYQEHFYDLLAAGSADGYYRQIDCPVGKRLGAVDCFEFLLSVSQDVPKGIFVVFGGSYDMLQMVLYDLHQKHLEQLHDKGSLKGWMPTPNSDVKYDIHFTPRKFLKIIKWRVGFLPKEKPLAQMTLWDVMGFFQASFVSVMEKWLGKDHPNYEPIKTMKAQRGNFNETDNAAIVEYNKRELSTLCQIMDKFRTAVSRLDITLKRWDGAGAVAAALYNKHDTSAAMMNTRVEAPEVFKAAQYAYSGGHIEAFKVGHRKKTVYHYDLNSAYPTFIAELPDLSKGKWIHGTGEPPAGFTMCKVEYRFFYNRPFYPLFFRTPEGSILYPQNGHGWYWHPEYAAAREYAEHHELGAEYLHCHEWWHFQPTDDDAGRYKPFNWVKDAYYLRQQWVDNPSEEWMKGGEKVIKLGLNSLYGKMCQQVGIKWVPKVKGSKEYVLELPPYFQLEWAGYVTSCTRAALMRAAMQYPSAIIAIATDGIFSEAPLELPKTPGKKILGEWDSQEHPGLTMVMAGVYWLHDYHFDKKTKKTDEKIIEQTGYSRGFDKERMRTDALVMEGWKEGKSSLSIPLERLIGLGSAMASKTMWECRGAFTTAERVLRLNGDNSKRFSVDISSKLLRTMVMTEAKSANKYELYHGVGYMSGLRMEQTKLYPEHEGFSALYRIRELDAPYPNEDEERTAQIIDREIADAEGEWA